MKIQLTISLLASSRIESLKRCLDSLVPLLTAIPSELIVVFTGTDDRVRETALAYTDLVLPFTWCDDFSAARNAALPYAKGEWFMFIDDDEWFEDCSELIRFFKSGEYRYYNSGHYIVRNYQNWSGTLYTDFSAYRLTKRTSETQFVYPTHESLHPHFTPVKYFESYVHHYGYLKVSGTAGKSSRNIPMLLRDIEKAPALWKNYFQLAWEYASEKKYAKAQECCEQGLANSSYDPTMNWLKIYLVSILSARNERTRAVTAAEDILKQKDLSNMMRIDLHRKLISMYAENEQYKECLAHGQAFEKLLKRMDASPDQWEKQQFQFTTKEQVKDPKTLCLYRMRCAKAALEQETPDPDAAESFLRLLPWQDEHMIHSCCAAALQDLKNSFPEIFGALILRLPADTPYLLLQHALEYQSSEPEKTKELLTQAIGTAGEYSPREELLEHALKLQIDFSAMAESMSLSEWMHCAAAAVNRIPLPEVQAAFTDGVCRMDTEDRKVHALEILFREKILYQAYLSKDALLEALKGYCDCVVSFYQKQYSPACFALEESKNFLPGRCQFALALSQALLAASEGHYADAVAGFRESLKFFPDMSSVIREASRDLVDRLQSPEAGEEFQQLSVQLKAAVATLCKNGQFREALPILDKLLGLLPKDLDLLKLRQIVLREMQ